MLVFQSRSSIHSRRPRKTIRRALLACYESRRLVLSSLGYASYQEYLDSDDWKAIKGKVLRRDPFCFGCGGRAWQVHHMAYSFEVLLGTRTSMLVPICRECHEKIEFRGKEKRTVVEANEQLFLISNRPRLVIEKLRNEQLAINRKLSSDYVGLVEEAKRQPRFKSPPMRLPRKKPRPPPAPPGNHDCRGCKYRMAIYGSAFCRKCLADR